MAESKDGNIHVTSDSDGVVLGEQPPGWRDDALAAFMDLASDNMLATHVHFPDQCRHLRDVDRAFVTFVDALLNPKDPIAPFFMLQAHASYRAAASLAMSCQSAPAFTVMRACLESSLYGHYFSQHAAAAAFKRWLSRHDDEESKRRVRNEFTTGNLRKCLAEIDPTTEAVAGKLYELRRTPQRRGYVDRLPTVGDGAREGVQNPVPHDGVQRDPWDNNVGRASRRV